MAAISRRLHFNSLPAVTRTRFLDSISERGEPRTILSLPDSTYGPLVGWALFALLGLGGLAFAVPYEFGSAYTPIVGPEFLLGIAVAFFAVVYGLLASVRAIVRRRSLPFEPGRYIFPLEVVFAHGTTIEWYPTATITAANTTHHYRNGVYSGTSLELVFEGTRKETLWLPTKEEPQRILRSLDGFQEFVRGAAARGDVEAIRRLDVFFEIRGAKELDDPGALDSFRMRHERESVGPLARELPSTFARAALVASVVAVLLAVPTWWLRNRLSDDAAYAGLSSSSRYVVDAYLRSGGRHRDEARASVLPAVVFREASEQRSATAMRAFLAEFPNASQAPAARAAIHTLYDEAFAAFVAAAPADPRLRTFMRDLLTFLETSAAPTVLVRFFPPSSEALAEADAELARRGRRESGHDVTPIAPYFGTDAMATIESTVTARLESGFARVFAADVFDLSHGGRILGGEADPAVPALDVRYTVRPSGALYVSERDQRAFVGIHLDFVVLMRAPGTTTTYEFTLAVEPPETFSVSYGNSEHASESSIYATMAERAFDQLADGLSATFFASAASNGAGK